MQEYFRKCFFGLFCKKLILCIYKKLAQFPRGLYFEKYPPGGGISADVIWGKNMKRGREKGGKCNRKRKKGERKRKKGERKLETGKKHGKIDAK